MTVSTPDDAAAFGGGGGGGSGLAGGFCAATVAVSIIAITQASAGRRPLNVHENPP
jgi:hypothetical protein